MLNADTLLDAFNGQLIFQTHLLKHSGNDGWVEPTIVAAHACMSADEPPDANEQCEWCAYRRAAVVEGRVARAHGLSIINPYGANTTRQ